MENKDKVRIGFAGLSAASLALGIKLGVRGSRLRGLQKLMPKVVTESPRKFSRNLKPGDLILMGNDKAKGGARFRANIFKKSEGDYFHTTMYLGGGKVAHLRGHGKGGIDPIQKYLKGDRGLLVIRPEASDKQIKEMVSYAKNNMDKYNRSWRYTGTAILGDTRAGRSFERFLYGNKVNRGKVLCSSLVADIQTRAGLKTVRAPQLMTTVDFRSLKNPPVIQFKSSGKVDYKTSRFQGLGFTLPAVGYGGYEYKRMR